MTLYLWQNTLCEGNHLSRRLRHQTASDHAGYQQAIDADLRQADDLLPAFHIDDGRDTGDIDHQHAA